MNHLHDTEFGGAPIRIGPCSEDEIRYVRSTWRESYHRSPDHCRKTYAHLDATVTPAIESLIYDRGSQILVARDGARCIGWLCYTPGRSIHTVHYAYTRFRLGDEEWRRRGVMTALLDAADLGRRFVYTHKGELKLGGRFGGRKGRSVRERPLDEEIVDALQRRDVTAVYTPLKEWLR